MVAINNLRGKVSDLINEVIIEGQRELTLKECCLSPLVFFRFSKVFLKTYTKDWHRPYQGTSITVSLLTYSTVASFFLSALLMIMAMTITGEPYQDVMLLSGAVIGVASGYIFTIQKEREAANKKLRRIQAIEKLERWKKLELLEVYKGSRKN